MKNIFDISPVIDSDLAVWPGDCPFQRKVSMDLKKGDHLTLSSISATLHLGAHADAPSHYDLRGVSMEACNLEPYLGLCRVLKVKLPKGERVGVEHLPEQLLEGGEILALRYLFSTGSFPDPTHFNEDFNSLSPELIEWLHQRGVVLVGIDTPSVDPFASKLLESHQALKATGMAVLEGLVLSHVPEDLYYLSALPLAIKGADASPVRAVLFKDPDKMGICNQ